VEGPAKDLIDTCVIPGFVAEVLEQRVTLLINEQDSSFISAVLLFSVCSSIIPSERG
jgi:hypothetical protein